MPVRIPAPKMGAATSTATSRCLRRVNAEGTRDSFSMHFLTYGHGRRRRSRAVYMLFHIGAPRASHITPPWALDALLVLVSQR